MVRCKMTDDPLIDIDLGPHNGILKLHTVEDVQKFVDSERSYWKWLSERPVQGVVKSPWHSINNSLTQISNALGNNNSNNEIAPKLQQHITQAFKGAKIPLSDSPVAKFIADMREESPISAAAAIGSWMNCSDINFSNFEQLRGVFKMAAFDSRITTKTASATRKSLEDLRKKYQESTAEIDGQLRRHQQGFANELSRQRSSVASTIRTHRRMIREFRKNEENEIRESIGDLRGVEELYREHMKMKGPVEYWNDKSVKHRDDAKHYRTILMIASGMSAAVLLIVLIALFYISTSMELAGNSAIPYVLLVSIAVFVTTGVFWLIRILARLYLSEHHLAIDAEERSVMAKTYLALTVDEQATDQDRGIVLGALFRPTADGIIKDDGAPEFSAASILSRMAVR